MLLAYQVIAIIVFICSFLGDYRRYSDSPVSVFANMFGSVVAGAIWPLLLLTRVCMFIIRAFK